MILNTAVCFKAQNLQLQLELEEIVRLTGATDEQPEQIVHAGKYRVLLSMAPAVRQATIQYPAICPCSSGQTRPLARAK